MLQKFGEQTIKPGRITLTVIIDDPDDPRNCKFFPNLIRVHKQLQKKEIENHTIPPNAWTRTTTMRNVTTLLARYVLHMFFIGMQNICTTRPKVSVLHMLYISECKTYEKHAS